MSQPLLEATNISHSFDYSLFTDIDFTIEPTKSAAIVGRSGSGKSTLLHIFSTFMKPNEGNVTLFGKDLYSQNDAAIEALRRYDVGIIFQFHYLFKGMSALENIGVATMLSGEQIDESILKKLEIDHLMSHKTSELSGGEQQRASIARVLNKKPRIIFADEPTGNLDSENSDGIIELLRRIHQDQNATIVMATHNKAIAENADRVFHLHDGRLSVER